MCVGHSQIEPSLGFPFVRGMQAYVGIWCPKVPKELGYVYIYGL